MKTTTKKTKRNDAMSSRVDQSFTTDRENHWVRSQVELAAVFGVERKTIQRWMKIDGNPGRRSNGRYNIAEWRSWRASRGSDSSIPDLDQSQLKSENLILQNERLRFQVGILKRDYWPADQVEIWGASLGAQIRTVVSKLHLAAADLVGLSVAECETILKQKEDEILEQLHTLNDEMKEWKEGAGTEVA